MLCKIPTSQEMTSLIGDIYILRVFPFMKKVLNETSKREADVNE